MKILDPGHRYELNCLDTDSKEIIQFVKRIGDKYPGNEGHSYGGTNLQEVIRVLINRIEYLDNQIHDIRNIAVMNHLRACIWLLEDRAAERHDRGFDYIPFGIELVETCKKCGHIGCNENH